MKRYAARILPAAVALAVIVIGTAPMYAS